MLLIMLELWQLGLLFLLGIGAGWINVLAGGGTILTMPLMSFMGLSGPVANGTNRIAIIAQNILSVWVFYSKNFSDFRLSSSLALCACFGAYFGAHIGVELEGIWFNRVLVLIMAVIMVLMIREEFTQSKDKKTKKEQEVNIKPKNLLLGHFLMIFAGVWGGFIQIGVGFILMPILYRVMNIDLVRTNMHKVFIALMFSIVSLFVFAGKVSIAWDAGIALAIGNAIGGYLGAKSAIIKGEGFIKRVVIIAMIAMMIKLLLFP